MLSSNLTAPGDRGRQQRVASKDVVYDVIADARRGGGDGYGRVILRVLRFSREESMRIRIAHAISEPDTHHTSRDATRSAATTYRLLAAQDAAVNHPGR
jgi:hypothetical protein